MTNRFMISVAAVALIAGTGFANAQGTGMSREAPSAGSTMQQNAPSSERGAPSAAPMNRDAGESKGMKSTETEPKPPAAGKNLRAQDDIKAGAKGEKSVQERSPEKSAQDTNIKGEKSKGMSSEMNDSKGGKDMKAEGRSGNMNAETRGTAETRSQTTTGQAGASAKLSTEQRTRITTVIREQHVQPVTNVNFSISVGTRVPRTVSFHPLPAEIVTVYPDWRGYEFFLVRDQIVVVNPRTLEIVAVLDA